MRVHTPKPVPAYFQVRRSRLRLAVPPRFGSSIPSSRIRLYCSPNSETTHFLQRHSWVISHADTDPGRTDARHPNRAVRSASPDRGRTAEPAGRLAGAARGPREPEEYPQGAGAAGVSAAEIGRAPLGDHAQLEVICYTLTCEEEFKCPQRSKK
jgi:hypothetical protein